MSAEFGFPDGVDMCRDCGLAHDVEEDCEECPHDGPIARDDDGQRRRFFICTKCDQEVRPGEEPNTWETVSW